MAFVSFIGRVLFVSAFILSAWQEYNEFGVDGGLAARTLRPKFDALSKNVLSQAGFKLPAVEMKYLVATTIAVKGLGSLLFIFDRTFGAYMLVCQIMYQALSTPILYDFYNYDADKKQFSPLFAKFTQNVQLLGGLLFFIAMKKMIVRRQMRKKTAKTKTM